MVLDALRSIRSRIRWLRRHWIEISTVFIVIINVVMGGAQLIAVLPTNDTIIYPLQTFYWEAGAVAFVPIYAVLILGFLLVIPYFISTFVSRIDPRTGIQTDPPKFKQLLVLITAAVFGFAILEDTIGHPNTLDVLDTNDHQYVLLWDVRDLNDDQFVLYECDAAGIVCDQLVVAEAGRGSFWDDGARLRVDDDIVVVHNRGRAIYEVTD